VVDIYKDKRAVMTLDAGGTNFVFSAIQGGDEIIKPIQKPSYGGDLNACLNSLVEGFKEVENLLSSDPVAISFGFPGPADYPNGVIGDLANLPAFRGGIALGPMLEEQFGVPAFINNDVDLFTYGEAIGGVLPEINRKLRDAGNEKQYKNLVGLALGTGFGGGIVINGKLLIGDNAIASEVWLMSGRVLPERNAEEAVGTRALLDFYSSMSGVIDMDKLMPIDIFKIAKGTHIGDKAAAKKAFHIFGKRIGDTLANLFTLTDGIAVIGGGITGASELYLPGVMEELNGYFEYPANNPNPRLVQKVYNIDQEKDWKAFSESKTKKVKVPWSERIVNYNDNPRVAICTSRIGTSKATSLGAYAFALNEISE
jgi:glucokinase